MADGERAGQGYFVSIIHTLYSRESDANTLADAAKNREASE